MIFLLDQKFSLDSESLVELWIFDWTMNFMKEKRDLTEAMHPVVLLLTTFLIFDRI